MNLCLIFLMWLLPHHAHFSGQPSNSDCNCPAVTNVQKTGGSTGSFSFSWDASASATEYKLWYHRSEGAVTSGSFFTTGTSYTFQNLPTGHYTFYVAAVCDSETSSWIGIEDLVEG